MKWLLASPAQQYGSEKRLKKNIPKAHTKIFIFSENEAKRSLESETKRKNWSETKQSKAKKIAPEYAITKRNGSRFAAMLEKKNYTKPAHPNSNVFRAPISVVKCDMCMLNPKMCKPDELQRHKGSSRTVLPDLCRNLTMLASLSS
jgi:hypothetical protein